MPPLSKAAKGASRVSSDLLQTSRQRNFDHLIHVPQKGGKFGTPIPTHFRSKENFVLPKDRIPVWNVSPGDRVQVVVGGEQVKGRFGTVARCIREKNLVVLKESEFMVKKRQPAQYPGEALTEGYSAQDSFMSSSKPIPVTNVRLAMTVRNNDGVEEEVPAVRVRKSAPRYNRDLERWEFTRWGLLPKELREVKGARKDKWVKIDWQEDKVEKTQPGAKDAVAADLVESSFIPSLASTPAELSVSSLDLNGGPHSRAQRLKRYHEKKSEAIEATRAERRAAKAEILELA